MNSKVMIIFITILRWLNYKIRTSSVFLYITHINEHIISLYHQSWFFPIWACIYRNKIINIKCILLNYNVTNRTFSSLDLRTSHLTSLTWNKVESAFVLFYQYKYAATKPNTGSMISSFVFLLSAFTCIASATIRRKSSLPWAYLVETGTNSVIHLII